MNEPVERVLVVGGGIAAWTCALALARRAKSSGFEVAVLDLDSGLTPLDHVSTLPTVHGLHRLLGLSDDLVLRFADASYILGERFVEWSEGQTFFHPYDRAGIDFDGVEFVHHWLRARERGMSQRYEAFSLATRVAQNRRAPSIPASAAGVSNASYGLMFDALKYLALLKAMTLKAGVKVLAATDVQPEVREGRISSVRTPDGAMHAADFFIDATGKRAVLLSALGGNETSWSGASPKRQVIVAAPPFPQAPIHAEIVAFPEGWIAAHALRDRMGLTVVSDVEDDGAVMNALSARIGLDPRSPHRGEALTLGIRPRPWIGNVVAIGEAAAVLDPLVGGAHLPIQLGVTFLLGYFPVNRAHFPEADVYNIAIQRRYAMFRDLQMAHYRLSGRQESFWRSAREASVSEALLHRIALFKACGRIAQFEDETMQAANWTAIFIGHGLTPDRFDPRAESIPEEDLIQRFGAFSNRINEICGEMPPVDAYLELIQPTAPSSKSDF